jgi:predicted site-specific integrase-resolvase
MHLFIGKATAIFGISVSTLKRWETDGDFQATLRTAGGHRRYDLAQLEARFLLADSSKALKPNHALAFARVSSYEQKQDLETQKTSSKPTVKLTLNPLKS